MATHCAGLIYERITELEVPQDSEPLTDEYLAVVIKSLLVHGASWGTAASIIDAAFPEAAQSWQKMAGLKQQFLGYGEVDLNRSISPTGQRATLVGWAKISEGDGHRFEMPLPPSLAASIEIRRLTATLAWFTPANYFNRNYRTAELWIDVPSSGIGTNTDALDANSARRGTVEHRSFQGREAVPFLDGTKLSFLVSCKEDAGKLSIPIAYAVAITLEVGATSRIDIHQEISTRIRQPVEVRQTP